MFRDADVSIPFLNGESILQSVLKRVTRLSPYTEGFIRPRFDALTTFVALILLHLFSILILFIKRTYFCAYRLPITASRIVFEAQAGIRVFTAFVRADIVRSMASLVAL